MTELELLGAVGATYLKRRIELLSDNDGEDAGVARFMLDRLNGRKVAAVVRAILADELLAKAVAIHIPRGLVEGQELPEDVLTDSRTVEHRHAPSNRPAMLLANTDDDQATSLQDIILLGRDEFLDDTSLWVRTASKEIGLPDTDVETWQTALAGLLEAHDWSLHQIANYVASTRRQVVQESLPLLDALGWALPALHLPRDSQYFRSISEGRRKRPKSWKRLYEKLLDRSLLLRKMRSPRQAIEMGELRASFEKVRDEIRVDPDVIEAYIEAPAKWCPEAEALAEFEWELEGVQQLFSGLKKKRTSMPQDTLTFFDLENPDALEDAEREYLQNLCKRRFLKDPNDDDVEFFEAHREELGGDRKLRAKWERFIYGNPIECTDFLTGLVETVERLWTQAESPAGKKRLILKASLGNAKQRWLDLNADLATYFATRYRGLPELLGDQVQWDSGHLFKYEALLRWAEENVNKYRRNTSSARNATQIKFDVALHVGEPDAEERYASQLIWRTSPSCIGMELAGDLDRVKEIPLARLQVARQQISRKGHLQAVSLHDVGTLEAAYEKDAGSLASKLAALEDIGAEIREALSDAEKAGRISQEGAVEVNLALKRFETEHQVALGEFKAKGLASTTLLHQAQVFGDLLEVLATHCTGDINRQLIWQPLLEVGCAKVEGGDPAAIVSPWHPLRLAAMAVKARWVCGLVQHILSQDEVSFGDARLFFSDVRDMLGHCYYPEIAVGYRGSEPVLLTESDTVNDYSLMEPPIRGEAGNLIGVESSDAARQIRDLLTQYLDLQPHEHADLSLLLYNCDSASLPLKTVDVLGSVQDGRNVYCSVVLRHRDRERLANVYKELIDQTGEDPDMVAPSEAASDFMSKLRIGILLQESRPTHRIEGERPFDMAFMHDVISRQAKITWTKLEDPIHRNILTHVPPRWPYTRLSAEDELKATSYLACPAQPGCGWSFINAVAAVIQRESIALGEHRLPARQISFQDDELSSALDEVHKLAEWVVNYDDLLDRRQLKAQGIRVIRYKREHTHGRTLIVSSTTDLRVLNVLVQRRLNEIALGLEFQALSAIAQRMIDEAAGISGDIVLRAAKRGISAGELVGIVLSKALVEAELGAKGCTCWVFLDDYAQWLGQREEQIADLMALSVDKDTDGLVLRVVVTECKYVAAQARAQAKRTSRRQLRDTVSRIESALFGDPGRLDRDLWLSRLSALLVDHADEANDLPQLARVRESLRSGDIRIDVRGYSHIFIPGPPEEVVQSEAEPIDKVSCGLQEVFGRDEVRALIRAYAAGNGVLEVRERLGDQRPWQAPQARRPERRVQWVIEERDARVLTNASDHVSSLETTSTPYKKPHSKVSPAETHLPSHASIYGSNRSTARPLLNVADEESTDRVTPPESAPRYGKRLDALISKKAQAETDGDADALAWLSDTADALRTALLGYGLQAKILGTRLTPNAALVRFRGSERLKVSDVEKRQSALLTTHGLNVISVSAQPREVVVTVARPQRETVSLWDVWKRRLINRKDSGLNLSFVLGTREIDGELLYLNLTEPFADQQRHDPHTLVAGATGSGKSVLLQCLLLDIAATNSSRLAHIYLIDPKMGVDYAAFERLPHVLGGVVTDQDRALDILERLVAEMDERYAMFRSARVRDLHTYNEKAPLEAKIPAIWVFHDEFAEWMLTENYKNSVVTNIQRLGVKARAAGIYLVFAAQRPESNVMPMQLRDNLGNRLILRVSSVGSSEIALGTKGAERLLGLGHLAARLTGEPDIIYAQAAYLADDDLDAAVDAIALDDDEQYPKST